MKKIFLLCFLLGLLFSCADDQDKKDMHPNILVHHTKPKFNDSVCIQIWDTALAYADIGDFKTSLKLLEKCNDIEPNNATILNAIGVSYLANGDSVTALKYYYSAISTDSLKPEAYASAGCLLENLAKYQDAIRILKLGYKKTNLNQFTHYNICLNLAITYYSLDSCDQTIHYLEIAKKHGFDNLEFDRKLNAVYEEAIKYCNYKKTYGDKH